jgi:hypothetical protein
MGKILRILVLALCAFCAAQTSHAVVEGGAYKTSYVCNDLLGNRRWRATAEIRQKEGDIYTITEKMHGVYSGFDGRISWVAKTDFERTKDAVKPLNMDQRIFDASGKPIAVVKQYFNYSDKIVTCTYEDLVKKTFSKKEFAFSGNIINRLLQGLCGQKFIEQGQVSKKMQVISPEPAIYDFELKKVDEEDIELNGRKIKAYKLCFDPMLGIFNFIKVFLPRSYVWHSAEPIFEWLKYDGLESGVNSPQVEIISLAKEETTSIPEPESQAR